MAAALTEAADASDAAISTAELSAIAAQVDVDDVREQARRSFRELGLGWDLAKLEEEQRRRRAA
jgi:hypothetical protein